MRPAYYLHRWRKVGDVKVEMWWRNGVPFATRRAVSGCTTSTVKYLGLPLDNKKKKA